MSKIPKCEYSNLYKPADKVFYINDLIPDRKTIAISLPEPPENLHMIDGWGLHPDEQYFRRKETPRRLIALEREAIDDLKLRHKSNRQETITGAKIIDMFWEKVEEQKDFLEEEIDFIKNMWYWRIYGYWFYNDGKPTYITGRHFMFLNFFFMPEEKENDGYPEYRDRHRREFLFRDYLRFTTETFAVRDSNGNAIKEDDGSYKMTDAGVRLFYGDAHPKNRRNGSTIMALSDMINDTESNFGIFSTVQAEDGEKTEEHFKLKLLPAWAERPFWIRPMWVGSNTPSTIRYILDKGSYGGVCLNGTISYTTSASETKKDGSKINGFYYVDEEGKTKMTRSDVLNRWEVIKNTMSLGDGTRIIGYSSHTTTVEDISAAGEAFLKILEMSDFYQRDENGQTMSGLACMQFPAYDGLEGFIDRFGMSVISQPTPRQMRLRPNSVFAKTGKGARELQQIKRDMLLSQGTSTSKQAYRQYIKKFPWTAAELHVGTSGDIGFDYEILDKRLSELRRLMSFGKEPWKRGNFKREGGNPEGKVVFQYDPDGKFEMSRDIPKELRNLKREIVGWDASTGEYVPMYEPVYKTKFTCGADPFEYENVNKAQQSYQSAQSDGGIAILWERDKQVDPENDPYNWQSRIFVLSYRQRPDSLHEYNEDVLMACEYFGAMLYLERNKTRTWEYFISRRRGGYLKYSVDLATGKRAEKPGAYMSPETKSDLFSELKDYILFRGEKEPFYEFLLECRNIQGKDQMTKYDRLTAHGMALLGSKSVYGRIDDELNNPDDTGPFDLGDVGFWSPRAF